MKKTVLCFIIPCIFFPGISVSAQVEITGSTLSTTTYNNLNTAIYALSMAESQSGKDIVITLTENIMQTAGVQLYNKEWKSLTIDGQGYTATGGGYCILDASSCKNITVKNLKMTTDHIALRFNSTVGNGGNYNIVNCTVTASNQSFGAISLSGSPVDVRVDSCTFIFGSRAVYTEGSATNVTVENCFFTKNAASPSSNSNYYAVQITAYSTNIVIRNNEFCDLLRSEQPTNVLFATNTAINGLTIEGNSFYETKDKALPAGWSRYIYAGGGYRGTAYMTGLEIKGNYFGSTAAKCAGGMLQLGAIMQKNVNCNFICVETSTKDQRMNALEKNRDIIYNNRFEKITLWTSSEQQPNTDEDKRGALTAYYNYYGGRPQITGNIINDFHLEGMGNGNAYLVGLGHSGSEPNFSDNIITNLTTNHNNTKCAASISAICLGAINILNYEVAITIVLQRNHIENLRANSPAEANAQHVIGIRFNHYGGIYEGPTLYTENVVRKLYNYGNSTNVAHFTAGFYSEQNFLVRYIKTYTKNIFDNLHVTATNNGTSAAIYFKQAKNAVITGNRISNMSVGKSGKDANIENGKGSLYGIYTPARIPDNSANDVINNNIIYNLTGADNSFKDSKDAVIAIRIADRTPKVYNNYIYNLTLNNPGSGFGQIIGLYRDKEWGGVIYNNIVSLCSGAALVRAVYNTQRDTEYYHNTVYVQSSGGAGGAFISTATCTAKNNIFDFRGGNGGYAFRSTAAVTTGHNNYYTGGSGTTYSNNGVTEIPSNSNSNSYCLLPLYAGALSCGKDWQIEDFILENSSALSGQTIQGANITTDIGGNKRQTIPVIGAWDMRNSWMGSVTTDWDLADNWTGVIVPEFGKDIHFHAQAQRDLHVIGSDRIQQRSIYENGSGKKLVVTPGHILEISGSLKDFDESNFIIQASASDVNASFIYPQGTTQRATVQLYSKAITPDTVKTSKNFVWQYITSPVKKFLARYMQGSWLRIYDETMELGSGKYWKQLKNTDFVYPFKGYEISRKQSTNPSGFSSFSGELVNNDTTIAVTCTAANTYTGGKLVTGNPYAAALDIQSGLVFSANMDSTVYLFHAGSSKDWDVSGSAWGTTKGQYLAVPRERAGKDGFPSSIASMQGFVVQLRKNETSEGSLTFRYAGVTGTGSKNIAMRTKGILADTDDFAKPYTATVELSAGETVKDKVWLFVDERTTRGFDNGYDGRKMAGETPSALLYASEEDGNYQVNSIPDINETYLSLQAEEGIYDYSLTFKYSGKSADEELFLSDLKTGNLVTISADSSVYHFHASATDNGAKRFQIITRKVITGSEDKEVRVLRIDGNTFVDSRSKNTAEINLFDLSGRQLQQTLRLAPGEIKALPSLPKGVYLVEIVTGNKKYLEKIIR
jgi:hypothetical protein